MLDSKHHQESLETHLENGSARIVTLTIHVFWNWKQVFITVLLSIWPCQQKQHTYLLFVHLFFPQIHWDQDYRMTGNSSIPHFIQREEQLVCHTPPSPLVFNPIKFTHVLSIDYKRNKPTLSVRSKFHWDRAGRLQEGFQRDRASVPLLTDYVNEARVTTDGTLIWKAHRGNRRSDLI